MDLEEALALTAMGRPPLDELPQVATEAMLAGSDSPSLRLLAGLDLEKFDQRDAGDLFDAATAELGWEIPSLFEAMQIILGKLADQVNAGTLEPVEAARRAWHLFASTSLLGSDLPPELHAVYELEDGASLWAKYKQTEHRKGLDREIKEWLEYAAGRKEQPPNRYRLPPK